MTLKEAEQDKLYKAIGASFSYAIMTDGNREKFIAIYPECECPVIILTAEVWNDHVTLEETNDEVILKLKN